MKPQILFLEPGNILDIEPGVEHRFIGLTDASIVEFSTHHEDSDSYRSVPSKQIGKYHRYDYIISALSFFTDLRGKSTIDCSSGPGVGTDRLNAAGAIVLGLDIDSKVVRKSQEKFSHLRFDVDDLCKLSKVKDGVIDIFVCSETVEHIDKPQTIAAVQQISRVVKSKGLVCVTTPADREICLSQKNVEKDGHKQYLSADDLLNAFSQYKLEFAGLYYKQTAAEGANRVLIFSKE